MLHDLRWTLFSVTHPTLRRQKRPRRICPSTTLARHEITTNLEEICQVARHALKSNGRIAMVHRPDRFLDIIDTMRQYNLAPKRIQFIYPKMGREANMLLIEAIKDGSTDGLKILPPLFVHKENGDYTDEIYEIYFGKKTEGES